MKVSLNDFVDVCNFCVSFSIVQCIPMARRWAPIVLVALKMAAGLPRMPRSNLAYKKKRGGSLGVFRALLRQRIFFCFIRRDESAPPRMRTRTPARRDQDVPVQRRPQVASVKVGPDSGRPCQQYKSKFATVPVLSYVLAAVAARFIHATLAA